MLNRVAVFIDNSNVFKLLKKRKDSKETGWGVCLYDPLFLAQKLVGDRQLSYVGFYCAPPPNYLLQDSPDKFKTQMQF